MSSGIYIIVNTENHKIYVGSTNRLNTRKNQHWYSLRHNKHPNKHLQSAWNKYGEDCFEFRIIELCPENKLIGREDYWIKHYNSMDRKLGYNLVTAQRVTFTKEHKRHISESCIGRPSGFKGHHHSERNKKKFANFHIGKPAPNKGMKNPSAYVPIIGISKSDGSEIKFKSIQDAAISLKGHKKFGANICNCSNGKIPSYLGYVWKKEQVNS